VAPVPPNTERRFEHAVGQLMDHESKPRVLDRRQARPDLAPHATRRHVVHRDDRAIARTGGHADGEVGAERLVQRIVERGSRPPRLRWPGGWWAPW